MRKHLRSLIPHRSLWMAIVILTGMAQACRP
jgi:hypothetical protein